MKTIRIFAAALAAALLAGQAGAEEEEAFVPPRTLEELDARLAEAFAASTAAGFQVALVDAAGPVWTGEYGFLDKEKTRPVEADSVFRAGSISKSFTGTLAQILYRNPRPDARRGRRHRPR